MNYIKVSAILLAAGVSERMGRDKLLLDYRGKSLLWHSFDLLCALPVFERIVVTSNARAESLALPAEIKLCINTKRKHGMSESVRIGVENATGSHFLFLNADQPKLGVADIMPLLETAKTNPDKIIFPLIDSKPSSPTIFPQGFRSELLSLSGDLGGRVVRNRNPDACLAIEADASENFYDIDTEEEYRGLF